VRPSRILTRRRRDEVGTVAILVAMFFAFLALPLGAVGVDVARMYVELERVQAAADAAATAGVTYMPDDFDTAKARAIAIAEDNGFPNSGTSAVTVTVGDKPTQLKVTVSSTIKNAFAKSFGVSTSTLSRYAVADFNGPAPMGSPCNSFGNEPDASTSMTGYGPAGSQTKVPSPATCANPQFWGAITGPETVKDQGAQFDARKCEGGEDGCASGGNGAANLEYDPRGFIYMIRVGAAGVGQEIRLQIYDPAYVDAGSGCGGGPTGTFGSGSNGYFPYATSDANTRYKNENNAFCAGDSNNSGKRFGTAIPTITSFALRNPVDNLNPFSATPLNPSQCTKQWPGYSDNTATNMSIYSLANIDSRYRVNIAKVYHQWVDLCRFTPTRAGDYYLQVRANVALPLVYTLDSTGAVAGNTDVTSQTGDDPLVLGNGTNQFSIRAVTGAAAGAVSVAPWERMRIFANADSATTTFNLVRVAPAAASKTLVISYFDVGEATGGSPGTVQITPPGDSKLGSTSYTSISGCVAEGPTTGTLSSCKVTGITPTTNNGKTQTIRVPIPANYTCTVTSAGGCWYRVTINFPNSTVTDATTWTARIVGEPVRLIE
jgi:hypothetical protein